MRLLNSLAKSSKKFLEAVFIFLKRWDLQLPNKLNLLKVFFKYFVKISNLETIENFKLIFLVEHVLMTASGI